MISKIKYKVPNGKLLHIQLTSDEQNQKIKHIRISGDFFAYPEEAIEHLEQSLENIPLEESIIHATITELIDKQNVQFIGIDAESLTNTILRCQS